MDGDLRSRVVTLEHRSQNVESRIVGLEAWRTQSDIADARKDEQWKNMDMRFNDLDKKIGGVSDTLSRIMWLVISGIVMAIVAFMVGGGFRVG